MPDTVKAETLAEIVDEMYASIQANKGMGIGSESTENSLHHYFTDRLFDVLHEPTLKPAQEQALIQMVRQVKCGRCPSYLTLEGKGTEREGYVCWSCDERIVPDLPPHNAELLDRLYVFLRTPAGRKFFSVADRDTLGGILDYVRKRTVTETAGLAAPNQEEG